MKRTCSLVIPVLSCDTISCEMHCPLDLDPVGRDAGDARYVAAAGDESAASAATARLRIEERRIIRL
jgi:hypothetical protein